MNNEWNPAVRVGENEQGLVVELDPTGVRSGSVFMTVDGNRLVVHCRRDDGTPDEIVLDCPSGYDLTRTAVRVDCERFRVELPRSEVAESTRQANWLTRELKGAASQMKEIKNAPWGHFSQN